MYDNQKNDSTELGKAKQPLESALNNPADSPIADPLADPSINPLAKSVAKPATALEANKELSISEKSLIIATVVISIILFLIFLNHAANENTSFGNKKVIGGLTIYITILFIGVDLLPSSSTRKKWYSIACRLLTVAAILLSLTFFR